MHIFKYKTDNSEEIGKIGLISSSFPIEAEIEARGWNFHIIVGKHINGNFICIPNWYVGSELAKLDDHFWNCERLTHYTSLGKLRSSIIASALVKLSHIV